MKTQWEKPKVENNGIMKKCELKDIKNIFLNKNIVKWSDGIAGSRKRF